MKSQEITVNLSEGLAAQPACGFVKAANSFKCQLQINFGQRRANAKSLLGILSLGIAHGDTFTLTADGENEEEAIAALNDAVQ